MDARITKDFTKYKLVNTETNAVEEYGLLYSVAQDRRNILWARGIKTKLISEPSYTDAEYAAHNRAFCNVEV